MKNLLIATLTIATLVSGGIATAADLDVEVKSPPRHCGGGAFHGFYLGIHGGGVSHTATRTDQESFLNVFVPAAATYEQNTSSVFGGGQIGYNYQCRNAVFGIEADGSWVNSNKTLRILSVLDPDVTSTITNRLDEVVTIRARAGVVAADNFLLYVTGGLASAHIRTTWSVVDAFFGTTDSAEIDERVWGWVAGLGAEWAFMNRFSLRAEAFYMSFGQRELIFATPNFPGAANVTHADTVLMARLALNVSLGGP